MSDLEQQCEDALFELCDARERYPLRCADELQKFIKLKNDINMLNMFQKPTVVAEPPSLDQNEPFDIIINDSKIGFDRFDHKLQSIINQLDNLKAVMDQIEREKTCLTNKLLES